MPPTGMPRCRASSAWAISWAITDSEKTAAAMTAMTRAVPAVRTPRAGHRSVDEEGIDRLRPLRVEDTVAELLGQDLGPPGVHQQGGIPDRQEANGGRGLRVGQRGIVQVQQATALLVPVL